MALSYSFHISSKKHSIKNLKNLVSVQKHNLRKFESNKFDKFKNEILIGSENLVEDVKTFYKDFFEDSLKKYNEKQKKESRKIENYFDNISNSLQKEIAVEAIIQVGDMEFWKNKSLEERKKMTPIFQDQINKLQIELPNYKIISAVIHYDESSPHIQIVGVPIKENCKTGLEKQVSKSSVFKKEKLEYLQDKLRENILEQMQNIYGKEIDLKAKEKGRNKDLFIKDYIEMKKEIENEINREYTPKIKRLKDISNNLEEKIEKRKNFLIDNNIATNNLKIIENTKKKKKKGLFGEYYTKEDVENSFKMLSNENYEVKVYQSSLKELKSENKALYAKLEIKEKELLEKNKLINNLEQKEEQFNFIMDYIKERIPKLYKFLEKAITLTKDFSDWNRKDYIKSLDKELGINNSKSNAKEFTR